MIHRTPNSWARWSSGKCPTPAVMMTLNPMQSRVARRRRWRLPIWRHCGFSCVCDGSYSVDKGMEGRRRDIVNCCRGIRGRHWRWCRIESRGGEPRPLRSSLRLLWKSSAKLVFVSMRGYIPPPTLSDSHSWNLYHVDGRICYNNTHPPRISVVILWLRLVCEKYYAWFGYDTEVPSAANWKTTCTITWSVLLIFPN